MFGRRDSASGPTSPPRSHDGPGRSSPSPRRLCAELERALAAYDACRSALDRDGAVGADGQVADEALRALWTTRETCCLAARALSLARPGTPAEEAEKQRLLSRYLVDLCVDHLDRCAVRRLSPEAPAPAGLRRRRGGFPASRDAGPGHPASPDPA